MKKIYIHVGIHKTGTTFLQKTCFPHLRGVHLVHKENYLTAAPDGIAERLLRLVNRTPYFVDLDEEKRALDRLLAESDEETVLISLEQLFGNPFHSFHNNVDITRGLRHIFPQASIIVTVRRQDDLLESLYRQALRRYLSPTVDGFIGYADGRFHYFFRYLTYPSVNARMLDLHRHVLGYVEAFGRDNVLVLPYERLKADQRGFLTELYRFIGVEPFYPDTTRQVHPSYTLRSCQIARVLNRFVRVRWREPRPWQFIPHEPFSGYLNRRASDTPFDRFLGAVNRRLSLRYALEHVVDRFFPADGNLIDDHRREMLMELHRESNRALDAQFDLDLARYGYY